MFSWLFGNKSKASKKNPEPSAPEKAELLKRDASQTGPPDIVQEDLTPPPPRDPDQVIESMGGPEEVAKIIKSLIAEDKQGR
ncbi:hypothetical protein SCOR_07550 [Sulfidibacter corallicola]|uniref:Uncharacterized protein n=1 Tax=Sulfidibacter corallicola TaxID=2818388 RepID=A0A8A4TQL7_SULCO|nr:hypothetical protein [Sulfidibacter corallicola]QTD51382.1 hypothetical protein J3U87_02840 [Sulfidibacter corallicola]